MKVCVDNYSTDGSSLSNERLDQLVLIYELCSELGDKMISYRDLQNIAQERKLFGIANAPSLIRTILPILRKTGFVAYPGNGEIKAREFFSVNGESLVKTHLAYRAAEALDDKKILELCEEARNSLIQVGIVELAENIETKHHGILLASEILKKEGEIYWDEFLFILSKLQDHISLRDAIKAAKGLRNNDDPFEYVSSNGSPIANTAYSYIRSFLIEAGILSSRDNYTMLNPKAKSFIQSLPPYEY